MSPVCFVTHVPSTLTTDPSHLARGLPVRSPLREDFADQFFALFPESLCILRIERITAYPPADGANLRISRDEFGDLAVLAILASDFLSRCNHPSPDRRRGTLRNRLE